MMNYGLFVSGKRENYGLEEFQYTQENNIHLETSENTGSNNFYAHYSKIILMRIEIPRLRKIPVVKFFQNLNCVHTVHKLANIIHLTRNLLNFTYLNFEVNRNEH